MCRVMTISIWEEGFGGKSSETLKYLYKLEGEGILKLQRTKEKENTPYYQYGWSLTKKGEDLTKSNSKLKTLWKRGKIKEFYEEIHEN